MFTKTKFVAIYASALAACAGADASELGFSAPALGTAAAPDTVVVPNVGTVKVEHIGLRSGSIVPPLGVGVDPSSGAAGDSSGSGRIALDPAWSGGPGAADVYGEQLVVPLSVAPGRTLANASCDVWNPNTGPGVSVAFELWSSSGGLLAATTIPSSMTVVFRSWLLASQVVADGGQYTLKLTPKNADGSWTTSAEPITVISCAVNSGGSSESFTVTQGVDLSDCLIITGSVAGQPSPALVGISIPAFTTYSYRWRAQPTSRDVITGLTVAFNNTTSASNVSSVRLKYMDRTWSKTTVTGVTFSQSGQTWVMSGTPSDVLDGRPGRNYFLEVATGGGGTAVWTDVEATMTR
jgi:hypothetical protein